jgi:hypothetical protein
VLIIWLCSMPAVDAGSWPWSPSRPAPQPQQPPHPAVVRVIAEEPDGMSQGSGTLVDVRDQYGLIVTNWHVVRDVTGEVNVIFPDGFRSAARVIHVDRDWDLAALLIWRPRVQAVPLASRAPRPGDALVVAGYGTGNYRAVSGRCTQYVAPSVHHPFEMVEVSTEARQGDSGGPIFNERGELAGVLFGSGDGTTSGSYAGRVREFLVAAWPLQAGVAADRPVAAQPPGPGQRSELQRLPEVDDPTPGTQIAKLAPLPGSPAHRVPPAVPGLAGEPDGVSAAANAEAGVSAARSANVTWEDFAGRTTYEQIKTVLAVIGLAAVFLRLSRVAQPRD